MEGLAYYVVQPVSNTPILPDTPVSELGDLGGNIEITAAAGEYEPASFVIKATKRLDGPILLSAGNLIGENGEISASEIEIKLVKVWYQAKRAWFEIGMPAENDTKVLVPELLLNDVGLIKVDQNEKRNYLRVESASGIEYLSKGSTVRLEKPVYNLAPDYRLTDAPRLEPVSLDTDKNLQVWVTVNVKREIPAGQYRGSLFIHDINQRKVGEIPMIVNVLPIILSQSRLEYGMYYLGRLHESKRESLSAYYKSEEQLRVELQDMVDHGINNPIIYQVYYESPELFLRYMTIRQELGMDNGTLYFMYLNSNNVADFNELEKFKNAIRLVKSLVKPYGTNEIYLYGKDEAKGQALTDQKNAWNIAHELGVKIYAAGYEGTFESVGNELDLFVLARSPMREEADKFHSVGNKIFSYANPQGGVENPYVYRLNYGLLLWASGFDGAMIYPYQHSFGDAWNDSDHVSYRDHNFTYPTSDGVVRTIAWEGLREGIDDVRYVTMLEEAIAQARTSGTSKGAALVAKADSFLIPLREELNSLNRYEKPSILRVVDLDVIRKEMIQLLLDFQE